MSSDQQQTLSHDDEEYYVYPVVEGNIFPEHDANHPFCNDLGTGKDCPCRDDPYNREQLQEWYDEGLIGPVDGDLIYRGKTI